MRINGPWTGLVAGVLIGAIGALFLGGSGKPVLAGSNDRFEDYILCTGAVAISPRAPTDGVWLLDYRTGRLLGTVIDRSVGKLVGFAEVDLVAEFGLAPKQNVHFLMTTGSIAQGQAALYVAETTTGKFAVYTMASAGPSGGVSIRRHDLVAFRQQAAAQ